MPCSRSFHGHPSHSARTSLRFFTYQTALAHEVLLNDVGFAEHRRVAVPGGSHGVGELGDGVGIRSREAGDCHAVGDAGSSDERECGERRDDGANHVELGLTVDKPAAGRLGCLNICAGGARDEGLRETAGAEGVPSPSYCPEPLGSSACRRGDLLELVSQKCFPDPFQTFSAFPLANDESEYYFFWPRVSK